MWLIDFNGIPLPTTQYKSETPRTAKFETLETSGSPNGAFSLYADSAPLGMQQYAYTFRWPRAKVPQIDYLFGLLGVRALLTAMMPDQSKRQTMATLVSIDDGSTAEDEVNRHKNVALQFMAEPFWYSPIGNAWRTVGFTSTASFTITAAQGNQGNVRALKYLILYIYNNITASVGSPFTITVTDVGGSRVYTFKLTGNMTGSSGVPITIDVGAMTVRAAGIDRYLDTERPATQLPFLALEPGAQAVTFTSPISGRFDFKDTWK